MYRHTDTQTRTQDYDWRLYTSAEVEDDIAQSDMSLRTRLANHPHSPHNLLTLPTSTDTARSNSSELESTLSGSMVRIDNGIVMALIEYVHRNT